MDGPDEAVLALRERFKAAYPCVVNLSLPAMSWRFLEVLSQKTGQELHEIISRHLEEMEIIKPDDFKIKRDEEFNSLLLDLHSRVIPITEKANERWKTIPQRLRSAHVWRTLSKR
jgi:hypothetical protein